MFKYFFGINYTRKKLLKRTRSSVMKEYYETPFPSKNDLINNVDIISLDFETTGLNIKNDEVVSIGSVKVCQLGVDLSTASHQLINIKNKLPEKSVVIHKITDTQSAGGINIETALPILLKQLSGNILLAHNAKIEAGFINKMCLELYDTEFVIPVVDTQYLAKRSFERNNQPYKDNSLRLFNLREALNMPAYKAHNALMDAVATAELFLAMCNKISPNRNGRLGEVLS